MATFSVEVSYAQLAVFDSTLAAPFNDWTDDHVNQGFAWRPGSVSFGTLDSAGPVVVEVLRSRTVDESKSAAERIIAVPFSVPEHGNIEIASIAGGVPLQIPPGEYELMFEHGRGPDHGMWANFYFRRVPAPALARVVRADAALVPPPVLVMTAEPA
ncbi:MAG TPA: competence protein ComJ [Kofleriaceae bacterium]|nr:competence protein ComJ [Kofleriaceae bacterium]